MAPYPSRKDSPAETPVPTANAPGDRTSLAIPIIAVSTSMSPDSSTPFKKVANLSVPKGFPSLVIALPDNTSFKLCPGAGCALSIATNVSGDTFDFISTALSISHFSASRSFKLFFIIPSSSVTKLSINLSRRLLLAFITDEASWKPPERKMRATSASCSVLVTPVLSTTCANNFLLESVKVSLTEGRAPPRFSGNIPSPPEITLPGWLKSVSSCNILLTKFLLSCDGSGGKSLAAAAPNG